MNAGFIFAAASLLAISCQKRNYNSETANTVAAGTQAGAGGAAFLRATSGEKVSITYASVTEKQTSLTDRTYTAQNLEARVLASCDIAPAGALELRLWNEMKVVFDTGKVVDWRADGEAVRIKLNKTEKTESGCAFVGTLPEHKILVTSGGEGKIQYRQRLAVQKLGIASEDSNAWLKDPVNGTNDFQLSLFDAQEKPLKESSNSVLYPKFSCDNGDQLAGSGPGAYVVQIKGPKAEAAWLATREYNALGRDITLGGRVSVKERVFPEPEMVSIGGVPTLRINFNSGTDANGQISYGSSSALAEPASSISFVNGMATLSLRGLQHVSDAKFQSVSVAEFTFSGCKKTN